MLPILFTWGDGALYTYTTMISIAVIVGGWLWIKQGKLLLGRDNDSLFNAALVMFFLGFFGARVLFVLTNLAHYRDGLFEITNLASGGIVFYGGLIGGALGLLLWCRKHGASLRLAFTAMVPAMCFAHAIGRLGCFAHGCCYGAICHLPWGVSFDDPRTLARPLHTPLHPTQIYEVVGLLALGFWTLNQNRRRQNRSQSLKIYLLGYGTLRFFVEFFRADILRGAWAGLSTSQWVSIAMIISCLFLDFKGANDHNSAHENRT